MKAEVDAVIAVGVQPPGQADNILALDPLPRDEWATTTKRFLRDTIRAHGHKLAFMTPDADTQPADVRAVINDHFAQSQIDELTVVELAGKFADNFLHTLAHRDIRLLMSLDNPLEGTPVFIVAAGPSLDRVGHLLPQCKEIGTVIAVNTAAQACLAYGCEPDLTVGIEAKDLSEHYRGLSGPVCTDVTSGPANWEAQREPWFLANNEPCLTSYILALGGPPLQFNGSVACAATSIGYMLGGNPVVLVGQDLGYPNGQVYGSHTPFGDIRCAMDDSGVLQFTGESKQMPEQSGIVRPAWGGDGACLTTNNLLSFARFFERLAQRHLLIHTEAGVRIDGAIELPLEVVLASITRRDKPALPVPEVADKRAVVENLKANAAKHRGQGHTSVPYSLPLLGLYVIPATIIAKQSGLMGADFLEAVTMAIDTGCEKILEALE